MPFRKVPGIWCISTSAHVLVSVSQSCVGEFFKSSKVFLWEKKKRNGVNGVQAQLRDGDAAWALGCSSCDFGKMRWDWGKVGGNGEDGKQFGEMTGNMAPGSVTWYFFFHRIFFCALSMCSQYVHTYNSVC